jgi:hypothetical protein
MKRTAHLCFALTALLMMLLLPACGLQKGPPEGLHPVAPASMFVEHEGNFCDGTSQDKFAVGYYGSDPLDTLIYLYIVCHQKDTIYRATYPALWFLEDAVGEANAVSDSVQVAELQAKMRALAEGKLLPPLDSIDVTPAGKQHLFGVDLGSHVQEVLYYSMADHKVHSLH